MKSKTFLLLLLLITTGSLIAQKPSIKYGDVSEQELKLAECSFFPDANSMVLGEYGTLYFYYHTDKGWQYKLEVVRRIKIFNKLDNDAGNIKISLYNPVDGSNREEMNNLKATTYNLVNGKIEKTKLSNSEKYETRTSDYRVEISFAMPNLQQGSVIEYKYLVTSDFVSNLSTWQFQEDIPTAVSEFRYQIPEFFTYTVSQVGNYIKIDRQEDSQVEEFTFKYQGMQQLQPGKMSSNSQKVRLISQNIPPILEEPFMNNRPNLPARVEFQLTAIKMPRQPVKMVATDYQEFTRTLMDRTSFGKAIEKGGFSRDKVNSLNGSKLDNAISLYAWISDHFSFNNVYATGSQNAGKKAFDEGEGSVADINLSLLAALRQADIKAYPILVSTRGHGIPHPVYPNYEDFNYVIAGIETQEGLFLCDASSGMPFGMLPKHCLNGQGWLASNNGGRWVDLKSRARHTSTLMVVTTIGDEEIESDVDIKHSGYAFIEDKQKLNTDGEQEFKSNLLAQFPEYKMDDIAVEQEESQALTVSFTGNRDLEDSEILYLQPILSGTIFENPFKREERYSTIDFPYPLDRKVIARIVLPPGYVAELPESVAITLPNAGGTFNFTARQMGNTINIVSMFKLDQTDFSPGEYQYLKQFYQLVADKNKELIVIKKT